MKVFIQHRTRLALLFLLAASCSWAALPPCDALVADLAGPDGGARARARQLLPYHGARAVPEVLPLLASDDPAVAHAAVDVLLEIGHASTAPGREAENWKVAQYVVPLLAPERPERERILGLRLLERTMPSDFDVTPVAAMLREGPLLCDKARTALERNGGAAARRALRAALANATPELQVPLIGSLTRLRDAESVATLGLLTRSADPAVRVASARGVAWTGDPVWLPECWDVLEAAPAALHTEALEALLILTDAMLRGGGCWQLAVETYVQLVERPEPAARAAALAALGRAGDGRCVGPMLSAIAKADARTRRIGIRALGEMPGRDVDRALAETWPALPVELRAALVPALAPRGSALLAPLLEAAPGTAAENPPREP